MLSLEKVDLAGQSWRNLWVLGFRCQESEVLNPRVKLQGMTNVD